ncbi:MAG: SDR family NAD(P)-dependent oxidoreductase [Planctomycetaceae bacterium]|jgi:acyl transferase domain-containing protein/NAD(P)-dependent dehydrogenase (short-subunit alcohol dehydrogenase family)|nr:SDR family NAD(P)-dependent oxidoreductase [Planctomycetaceae bacterium]
MENFSDKNQLPDGNLSLAVIGMACRLPDADDINSYWDLILRGGYAITELPQSRFDRELYFDPKKGIKGKSYISHGGIVNYSNFDPLEFSFPSRLIGIADAGAIEMCRVAASACRDAGMNPFRIPYRNTGIYLGSTCVGQLYNEINYSTHSPKLAQILPNLKSLQDKLPQNELNKITSEIIQNIRKNSVCHPKNGYLSPQVQSISAAVSESLGLTGVSLTLDAACSSSLNALAMARRDLRSGFVDMAIVGGGTYLTQGNEILFSNAQSGSPDGSFPFSDLANGVIPSEGYVAIVVKTLERALTDGDQIHAIIYGIGLSSDGNGRSHWAPRVEGEIAAILNAYKNPSDLQRLAYYEAHATSTQVGDKTELNAIQTVFADKLTERVPLGSVKRNIGHTLEAAGIAGLIKTILIFRHNTIPPQICPKPLNKNVDWEKLPFYLPEAAAELPVSKDGRPRLAAVSAFGVGGINAHAVIQEPSDLGKNYRNNNYNQQNKIQSAGISVAQNPPHEPIAVIGVGSLFAGSLNFKAFESLVKSGVNAVSPIPSERWFECDYNADKTELYRTQIKQGGFVKEFKYDWKRHKIPPKQIAAGNRLQFMILDVVDTAMESAGFNVTKNELDQTRTGVVVGSNFCTDFFADLSISYKLAPFRQLLLDTLQQHGISDPKILNEIANEYTDKFFERITSLFDEAGGFTASSLASRITKIFDLSGGCVTVDAGSASAVAAIAQSVAILREKENDLVICAAGSSNMLPVAFIDYERLHVGFTDGIVPAEGAAVLIMKRLSDVKFERENADEKILFLIHGIGVGFDADIESAYSKAIEQAWASSGLSKEQLTRIKNVGLAPNEIQQGELSYKILKSFYPDAEFSNIAKQIGDTQAASGMASLLETFERIAFRTSEACDKLPVAESDRNIGVDDTFNKFGAISASDTSGIVYHILIEQVDDIPKPVWAVGFAPEQPLRDATLACSASGISKQLEYKLSNADKSSSEKAVDLANGFIVTKNNVGEIDMEILGTSISNCGDVELFDGSDYRLVRFTAGSIDGLRLKLESRVSCAKFEANEDYRIIFITNSESNLSEQIAYSLQHLDSGHAEKLLLRKNIIFGKRQPVVGKIAFLFSGQGSQYEGMLKPLITSSKSVKAIADELDIALQNVGVPAFSQLAWSNRSELGVDVFWTQISIFAADLILFNTAKKIGIVPDVVAGHSYGEYPAITAAGGWSVEQGINATKLRCNAILNSNGKSYADKNINGGNLLAAQMNEQAAVDFCTEMSAKGMIIFVANSNSPKQTVLGANGNDIQTVYSILNERKIPSIILEVPRPFHTPLMDSIREPLNVALEQVPTSEFSLQFFSSVSNRFETVWNRIHKNLTNQLVRPVRFVGLVEGLLGYGCTAFIECGPGNVLTGLNQKIIAEYLTKNQSAMKPICISLDAKETDKKSEHKGELQLLTVRGMLEIAGYFDEGQKNIAEQNNNCPNKIAKEISSCENFVDDILSDKIRRKLRGQADFFNVNCATKKQPNESIPQFITDLAKKSAVSPEPLFAYWKSHPNDNDIFETKNKNSVTNQTFQAANDLDRGNKLLTLSQDEYTKILDENRNEPIENLSRNSTRFVPRLVAVPLIQPEHFVLPVSGRVLIIGTSPVGIALERLLRGDGVDVVSVKCNGNVNELTAKVDEVCQSAPTPHCFVVPSREEWNSYHTKDLDQSIISQWNAVDWKLNRDRRVLNPFAAVQHWYRGLANNKELFNKGSIFVTTFLSGNFGYTINESGNCDQAVVNGQSPPPTPDLVSDNICGGTITGLAKSIFLEAGLATQFKFRAVNIDLPESFSSKQCAETLINEWACGTSYGEIAYNGTNRYQLLNVPDYLLYKKDKIDDVTSYSKSQFVRKSDLPDEIKPQGTWVVTGGARGITAFTARKLAKEFGIKLNLIGSSPLPSVPSEWIGLNADAKKMLQKNIMLDAKQNGRNPISEWNKIEREIDLTESLKLFDEEGISYDYYACNVADFTKLELTFETIRRKHGAISGVLHGAGVDFSAAFQKKDLQRVELTYAVKVDAAAAIMYLLQNEPLKHFLAFGSCSGRLGSIGQTDYGLANDALAKLVSTYAGIKRDCRCICFAWGAWDEIGMAVKSGIKDSVALKGFLKIPPADAYKFILDELGLKTSDSEVMICDWKILVPRFEATRNEFDKIIIETKNQTDNNKITKNDDIKPQPQDFKIDVTEIANVKVESLNKIVAKINTPTESIDQNKITQQNCVSAPALSNNNNIANRTTKRMIVRMTARPCMNICNDNNSGKSKFRFGNYALIYGDNPDSWVLAEKLLERGVNTIILPETEDEKIVIEKLRGLVGGKFPLHLFIMSSRNSLALFDPLKSADLINHWERRRRVGFDVPAALLREWLKLVAKSGKLGQSSIAAAVSLGGDFATGNAIESQSGMMGIEGGLITGLLKGIYAELGGENCEQLIVRIIDAAASELPVKIAETIIGELGNGTLGDKFGIESAIIDGQIMMPRIIVDEFKPNQNQLAQNKITNGGVWIATDGASGINAENVKTLATRYKLKIHILAQPNLQTVDESLRYLNAEELAQHKQKIIRRALKNGELPSKVWDGILQSIEVDRNLRAMRELGIDVVYHQCDITDRSQLASVIDEIHRTASKISGLIHGANFAAIPSSILKMTPKDIANEKSIIASKVDATITLMQLLKDDPVEAFILFGSVSGRFGEKYNAAYSAANDALCKLPKFYHRIKPNSYSVGFHWHNWDNANAATQTEIYNKNEAQKSNLLQPKEGIERFIEELESGDEYEVVISNDEYYRNIYSPELKLDHVDLKFPLADEIVSNQMMTVWNPLTENLISDHRLADKPILPAAFMIESIVEAGMIFADKYSGYGIIDTKNPVLLRNFDIVEGLRFFSETPLTMRTEVDNFSETRNQNEISCRLLSTFANSKGIVLNPNRFHAGSDVLIYPNYESISEDLRNSLAELLAKANTLNKNKFVRNTIQYVPRGSKMYHGSTLQELQCIAVNGSEIIGESITQPLAKITGNRSVKNWITHPASMDACLYLCGAATWNITGGVGLPKSMNEILLLRKPIDGEKTNIYVIKTEQRNNVIKYDFIQIGEDNNPICFCRGYNCRLLM